VRAFIRDNLPADIHAKMKLGHGPSKEDTVRWQRILNAKGWAGLSWPKEWGGPGWTAIQKMIFLEENQMAPAPELSSFNITMIGPVLLQFGTEEQKKRFLPRAANIDDWWCQGFSEPGAGSDLASLKTAAKLEGDHYVVNGQKIWTSTAHHADWCFVLVRTNPNARKRQEGISFLLVDMKTPGIRVEAIVTTDVPMPGQQEVNQVFYDDVKVPKENLIGKENEGWTYAKYLLEFERGNAGAPGLKRAVKKIRKIASETDASGERLIDDISFRSRLDQLEIDVIAMEFVELKMFSAMAAGARPGAESSMLKCRNTDLQLTISELSVEAVGYYVMPFIRDTWAQTNEPRPGPDYAAPIGPYYFNLRKASIYAGSNEIQRNIMAKAVLGL
jgi:alkylation response protein AidB-like acyl-CoA dehydrogenase